jgi:hypothetical protein
MWIPAFDLILHPPVWKHSILVILCFKVVKTFDDAQKLKIIALGLHRYFREENTYMLQF